MTTEVILFVAERHPGCPMTENLYDKKIPRCLLYFNISLADIKNVHSFVISSTSKTSVLEEFQNFH